MKRYGKNALLDALNNGAIVRFNEWFTLDAGYRVIIDGEIAGYIVGDLFTAFLRDGLLRKLERGYAHTDYVLASDESSESESKPASVDADSEYRERENEFMQRTDALCENKPAHECDCSACPCRELCEYLHTYDPNKKPVTTRARYAAIIVDVYSAAHRLVYIDAINDDHARKIASVHCDVCERVEHIEKI